MKIQSKQIDNLCFISTNDSGHGVVMEGQPPEGHAKRGANPMELVLMAAAGCSSIDVVSISQKQQQKVRDCQTTVTAERAETEPAVFTKIHIHFTVYGQDLKESAIEQAINLSAEKYCSVAIMLGKTAKVTHSFEVINEA